MVNGDFVLYKPAGITLKDMRIRERLLPEKIVDTGKFSKELFKEFAHLLLLFYN